MTAIPRNCTSVTVCDLQVFHDNNEATSRACVTLSICVVSTTGPAGGGNCQECVDGGGFGGSGGGGSSNNNNNSSEGNWESSKVGSLCENSLQGEEIGESFYFAMVNLDIGFRYSGSSSQPPQNYTIRIPDICIRVNNKSTYNRQRSRIIAAFDQAVFTTEAYLDGLSSANIKVNSTSIREALQLY